MPTNLEYRERERQRKGESRRQASDAKRRKERQRARARDKKKQKTEKTKGDILLEKQHENFEVAMRKSEMLAATKVKMSGSEKKSKQTKNTTTCTTFPP